jgi:hypothetical protein
MINLGSIAKQVTVSGTAKELRAVATPQATSQQLPAEPSTGKDPTNGETGQSFGCLEPENLEQ